MDNVRTMTLCRTCTNSKKVGRGRTCEGGTKKSKAIHAPTGVYIQCAIAELKPSGK